MNNFESEEAFHEVNDLIKRGDVIGINGNPGACPAAQMSCSARSTQLQCVCDTGKSKKGELSIFPIKITIFSLT